MYSFIVQDKCIFTLHQEAGQTCPLVLLVVAREADSVGSGGGEGQDGIELFPLCTSRWQCIFVYVMTIDIQSVFLVYGYDELGLGQYNFTFEKIYCMSIPSVRTLFNTIPMLKMYV